MNTPLANSKQPYCNGDSIKDWHYQNKSSDRLSVHRYLQDKARSIPEIEYPWIHWMQSICYKLEDIRRWAWSTSFQCFILCWQCFICMLHKDWGKYKCKIGLIKLIGNVLKISELYILLYKMTWRSDPILTFILSLMAFSNHIASACSVSLSKWELSKDSW